MKRESLPRANCVALKTFCQCSTTVATAVASRGEERDESDPNAFIALRTRQGERKAGVRTLSAALQGVHLIGERIQVGAEGRSLLLQRDEGLEFALFIEHSELGGGGAGVAGRAVADGLGMERRGSIGHGWQWPVDCCPAAQLRDRCSASSGGIRRDSINILIPRRA